MDTFTSLLSAGIGSGLMMIFNACLQRYWHNKDVKDNKLSVQAVALKVILMDRVTWLGKSYISNGVIAIEDKQNLKAMHKAAQGLGLDGDLDTIMEEVDKLKVA